MSSSIQPTPYQHCLVGMLFVISAVVMAVSSIMGQTHSRLDILLIVFATISVFIACDQFRRAFMIWHATRKKTEAVVDSASDV